MAEIRFYRATGELGWLSNLHLAQIAVGPRIFRCSEFAYQWAKFTDPIVAEWAMQAPTATLCAQLAHSLLPWQVTPGWSEIKVERMRLCLREKFLQHNNLAVKLLATGDATLIEESKTDAYWGVGKKGTGKNMLGQLLMELRTDLREGKFS